MSQARRTRHFARNEKRARGARRREKNHLAFRARLALRAKCRVLLAWLAKRVLCSFALGKRLDRFLGKLGGLLLLKLEQFTKGKKKVNWRLNINWYVHVTSQLPLGHWSGKLGCFFPSVAVGLLCWNQSSFYSGEHVCKTTKYKITGIGARQGKIFVGLVSCFSRLTTSPLPCIFHTCFPRNFEKEKGDYSQSKYFSSHIPILAFSLSGVIRCTCVACLWDWTTGFKYWAAAIYGRKLWCAPICESLVSVDGRFITKHLEWRHSQKNKVSMSIIKI